MAKNLTDEQKERIIADRREGMSVRETAKRNNVSATTVQRLTTENIEVVHSSEKNKYNARIKCDTNQVVHCTTSTPNKEVQNVMNHLNEKTNKVCEIIDLALESLAAPDKFKKSTPAQTATAIGIIIDKWTHLQTLQTDTRPYRGVPATLIAPIFTSVLFDIDNREHLEYVFPGGRGSTKSSFVSIAFVDRIMKNDEIHGVVMRQVGDTLRSSVYQQILWAIEALGLSDEFKSTVSPLEITRIKTGQKIYFRGADDPGKIKSIKVPFGYIGVLWFEELDQFAGPEAIRKIEQSVIRGGDEAYIFKSFNPPKSAQNWANKYIKIPKENRLVTESTYLTVPKNWLGKPFIDEAEFLKQVNPTAYENEYLGVANGTGGNVFDNVSIRKITDEEIGRFDRLYRGVDWGWFPDPYHYICCHYDAARLRLFIFDEYRCNKRSNSQTAHVLKSKGVTGNDLLICDSAEEKSISNYKDEGLMAIGAKKPPGSVEYGMKWLQSLNEIIIDNIRCPYAADEFLNYEYDRDKNGDVVSGYPDKNNHSIDAIRYALNKVILGGRMSVLK